MDVDRWKNLAHRLEHPGRTKDGEVIDPWPQIDFAGRTGADKVGRTMSEEAWSKLEAVNRAARAIAEEAEAYADSVMGSRKLSEEGKRDEIKRYRDEVALPKLRSLRETVYADAAQASFERYATVQNETAKPPESPYAVAAEMQALVALRERAAAGKKVSLPELAKMPLSTRRAVALSDPIASGVNESTHKAIRNAFLQEVGGAALISAEEQLEAVRAVGDALDMAAVQADRLAKVGPLTPAGVAAAEARAERDEAKAN